MAVSPRDPLNKNPEVPKLDTVVIAELKRKTPEEQIKYFSILTCYYQNIGMYASQDHTDLNHTVFGSLALAYAGLEKPYSRIIDRNLAEDFAKLANELQDELGLYVLKMLRTVSDNSSSDVQISNAQDRLSYVLLLKSGLENHDSKNALIAKFKTYPPLMHFYWILFLGLKPDAPFLLLQKYKLAEILADLTQDIKNIDYLQTNIFRCTDEVFTPQCSRNSVNSPTEDVNTLMDEIMYLEKQLSLLKKIHAKSENIYVKENETAIAFRIAKIKSTIISLCGQIVKNVKNSNDDQKKYLAYEFTRLKGNVSAAIALAELMLNITFIPEAFAKKEPIERRLLSIQKAIQILREAAKRSNTDEFSDNILQLQKSSKRIRNDEEASYLKQANELHAKHETKEAYRIYKLLLTHGEEAIRNEVILYAVDKKLADIGNISSIQKDSKKLLNMNRDLQVFEVEISQAYRKNQVSKYTQNEQDKIKGRIKNLRSKIFEIITAILNICAIEIYGDMANNRSTLNQRVAIEALQGVGVLFMTSYPEVAIELVRAQDNYAQIHDYSCNHTKLLYDFLSSSAEQTETDVSNHLEKITNFQKYEIVNFLVGLHALRANEKQKARDFFWFCIVGERIGDEDYIKTPLIINCAAKLLREPNDIPLREGKKEEDDKGDIWKVVESLVNVEALLKECKGNQQMYLGIVELFITMAINYAASDDRQKLMQDYKKIIEALVMKGYIFNQQLLEVFEDFIPSRPPAPNLKSSSTIFWPDPSAKKSETAHSTNALTSIRLGGSRVPIQQAKESTANYNTSSPTC